MRFRNTVLLLALLPLFAKAESQRLWSSPSVSNVDFAQYVPESLAASLTAWCPMSKSPSTYASWRVPAGTQSINDFVQDVVTANRPSSTNGTMLFDGEGDNIYCTPAIDNGWSNGFTVAMWSKWNSLTPNCPAWNNYIANQGAYVQNFPLKGQLFFWVGNSDTKYIQRNTPTNTFTTGVWNHWTFSWDGGTNSTSLSIYKNAAKVDSTSSGAGSFAQYNQSTQSLFIGRWTLTTNTAPFFCDDFMVWSRCLTASEVTNLYNIQKGTSRP